MSIKRFLFSVGSERAGCNEDDTFDALRRPHVSTVEAAIPLSTATIKRHEKDRVYDRLVIKSEIGLTEEMVDQLYEDHFLGTGWTIAEYREHCYNLALSQHILRAKVSRLNKLYAILLIVANAAIIYTVTPFISSGAVQILCVVVSAVLSRLGRIIHEQILHHNPEHR